LHWLDKPTTVVAVRLAQWAETLDATACVHLVAGVGCSVFHHWLAGSVHLDISQARFNARQTE
jgi:hypothetical protein